MMERRNRTPEGGHAWHDLPFLALGLVLVIPLAIHLAGIVLDFLADTRW